MSTQYDVTGSQQVTAQIVEAVAAQKEVDPLDLQPLYEIVDPEALEALFAPTSAGTERDGRIEFTYAGCRVTLAAAGERTITVGDATTSGQDHNNSFGRQELLD
ncbi:HalOD1 output domain-containing protein [Natrinema sp. SYSU A 869]|uniref:HalOD1 output domain-containing protein n=1 Tax=Natrinema sp. SYSU A 869 TaxID=2871694 RepID=UPI001CA3FC61|nr:HalOD1 output domain-containing protein [Natrinema sp. SYSU A 869]